MQEYIPNKLPLNREFETKKVFKKVASARTALAELKGISKIIPNETM